MRGLLFAVCLIAIVTSACGNDKSTAAPIPSKTVESQTPKPSTAGAQKAEDAPKPSTVGAQKAEEAHKPAVKTDPKETLNSYLFIADQAEGLLKQILADTKGDGTLFLKNKRSDLAKQLTLLNDPTSGQYKELFDPLDVALGYELSLLQSFEDKVKWKKESADKDITYFTEEVNKNLKTFRERSKK